MTSMYTSKKVEMLIALEIFDQSSIECLSFTHTGVLGWVDCLNLRRKKGLSFFFFISQIIW